jgi:hypothetical protein
MKIDEIVKINLNYNYELQNWENHIIYIFYLYELL